jgi:hypothetical protein
VTWRSSASCIWWGSAGAGPGRGRHDRQENDKKKDEESDDTEAEEDDEGSRMPRCRPSRSAPPSSPSASAAPSIFALPAAANNVAQAAELAFNTDLTVEQASKVLGTAPKAGKDRLDRAMAGRSPNLGTDRAAETPTTRPRRRRLGSGRRERQPRTRPPQVTHRLPAETSRPATSSPTVRRRPNMRDIMTTYTEDLHAGAFIASEAEGTRSRDAITVLSGQNLKAGAVLGKVAHGTASSAAFAGNTGNGVMGAVTLGANVKPGVYKLVILDPVTNAGSFEVEGPDGILVGPARLRPRSMPAASASRSPMARPTSSPVMVSTSPSRPVPASTRPMTTLQRMAAKSPPASCSMPSMRPAPTSRAWRSLAPPRSRRPSWSGAPARTPR